VDSVHFGSGRIGVGFGVVFEFAVAVGFDLEAELQVVQRADTG
jgi:hypothetical protein